MAALAGSASTAQAEALTPVRSWGPWQTRFAAGGELSATRFGIGDFGLRKGPLSIQILTDTLDVRLAPDVKSGRWWVGLRVEAFAAGLMISPWTNGAPDPTRAWYSGYAGADGGYIRYLSGGFYTGIQASTRLYFFWAGQDVQVPPPGPTPLFTVEALFGHYTPISHIWARAGVDAELTFASPHLAVEATVRPDWVFAPRIEVRAAWARDQDFLMRTRLGGLNPYVVPLAGAGWAEFWVESFVALRLGPSVRARVQRRGVHTLEASVLADIAGFEGRFRGGFGLLLAWRFQRWFVEASGGYAPFIDRQEGITRLAGFLLVGMDWGASVKRPKK